jgi:hypothetical protein
LIGEGAPGAAILSGEIEEAGDRMSVICHAKMGSRGGRGSHWPRAKVSACFRGEAGQDTG